MHVFRSLFRPLSILTSALAVFTGFLAQTAFAAPGITILRDAEIESLIREEADSLFRAANIPPNAVKIRILADPSLNAFVTTGNRMFIHSGLLLKTTTPNQMTGIIAHETGHIAGGHMAQLSKELTKVKVTNMVSLVLGMATAIATGRGDAAVAATALGQNIAAQNFFSYSRTQESSADAFALKILDLTNQSAKGLLDFFKTLQGQEFLATERQDPYMRTHPLTEERVDTVRNHVENSHIPTTISSELQARHNRMVAKLFGFIEPQTRVLQRYPETDVSIPARYAQAIAFYRRGNLDKALPLIDSLIAEAPDDPYFYELRGQILVENARLAEGLTAYDKAMLLSSDAPLIAISYGHALTESGTPDNLAKAQTILRKALQKEEDNSFAWQLYGIALGRSGDENRASYALSEYGLLTGDYDQAIFHAEKAAKALGQNDPLWIRLQDIILEAKSQRMR